MKDSDFEKTMINHTKSKTMNAQQQIMAKYGTPENAYFGKYCANWEVKKEFPWFPAEHIFINKDFEAKLRIAFKFLQERGFYKELKTFDGCFAQRKVRGMNATSLHSWAMAIDLNASTNKLGQNASFSNGFLQCFRDAGLFCGADFHSRKDPMHFALFNG